MCIGYLSVLGEMCTQVVCLFCNWAICLFIVAISCVLYVCVSYLNPWLPSVFWISFFISDHISPAMITSHQQTMGSTLVIVNDVPQRNTFFMFRQKLEKVLYDLNVEWRSVVWASVRERKSSQSSEFTFWKNPGFHSIDSKEVRLEVSCSVKNLLQ